MDRGEDNGEAATASTAKSKTVLHLSTSSTSLNSTKSEVAAAHENFNVKLDPTTMTAADDASSRDDNLSEKSDESTENLSFLNESDLIDDILIPENIISDDEMSNPENCVYAYRGSVSESPDLLLRNQHNNQQDDETDFLEMDFDPEPNSDADICCFLDFQHLLIDSNKPKSKSCENGEGNIDGGNKVLSDEINLNSSSANVTATKVTAANITVAPSTSHQQQQYVSKEEFCGDENRSALISTVNKNTGTIPKKPVKSSNCTSYTPPSTSSSSSSHFYNPTKSSAKLKDTSSFLIAANNNSNNINNNHLNSMSCVNKKFINNSQLNNNNNNYNYNNNNNFNCNNNITNINYNHNNNNKNITNNNITSYDHSSLLAPSSLATSNQISVLVAARGSSHYEKTVSLGGALFKNSASDKNIQLNPVARKTYKTNTITGYSNGDAAVDNLLYSTDKVEIMMINTKNSVNIFNLNCDDKLLIDALESIGLEPNKTIIKNYFINLFDMDTSHMDLTEYLVYLSKRNCDFHKLRDLIELSCPCDKLNITFHPLQDDRTNTSRPNIVNVPIKEILKRWNTNTNLKKFIKLKNPNYHTMNVLGKIINILRQPRQRLVLENFIEIPNFYRNGYLNVSKLLTSS